MSSPIPIQNIYYLLCYAWNRLDEGEIIGVGKLESTELVDLFATVLINGTNHLLRRGLDQGYVARDEELAGIRGRIDIETTVRRLLATHGRAHCRFDELQVDTLPNRILKSSLRRLANVEGMNTGMRKKLNLLYREMDGISDIRLIKSVFKGVQLHSNNRFYRFLLSVCELVADSVILDERTGKQRFRDFIRDEKKMPKLFEDFVFNFYRKERPDLFVRRDQIRWAATSSNDPELSFLPTMLTDISIRDGERTLIIDTKYYKETMQEHHGKRSVVSSNMYQLFSYLKNLETRGGADGQAGGMLLYPAVDQEVDLEYQVGAHAIRIATINLAQNWQKIRRDLLAFVDSYGCQGLSKLAS